jgi:hypothetical protein
MDSYKEIIKTNLITWSKYEANTHFNTCWLFDHSNNKYYFFWKSCGENYSFQNFYNIKKILKKKTLIKAYNGNGLQLFFSNFEY